MRLVATVVGALGGFTAVFVVVGYGIVLSFSSSIGLYGLADFPLDFYKEAVIGLFTSVMAFYSQRFYLIPPALAIVLLPLLDFKRGRAASAGRSRYASWLGKYLAAIVALSIVVATLSLGKIRADLWHSGITASMAKTIREIILYSVSIPALCASALYLARNYGRFSPAQVLSTRYGFFLFFSLLLLISIPVGYGSAVYDVDIYRVDSVECRESPPPKAFETAPAGEFKVFYLMGHTSGREVFFDASTVPASLILVDRGLIKTIKISDYARNPMRLRALYEEAGAIQPPGKKAVTEAISHEDSEWAKYAK